jgi:putative Holliday junction resolvase
MANQNLLALDVGEKRVGVALADSAIRIAIAYDTINVDGTEVEQIKALLDQEKIDVLVVGYPRNQSGDATSQTAYVESFVDQLQPLDIPIEYQDESVTSIKAEEILKQRKKPYEKGEIDALAASLILQDYLEAQYGRL